MLYVFKSNFKALNDRKLTFFDAFDNGIQWETGQKYHLEFLSHSGTVTEVAAANALPASFDNR